MSLRAFGKLPSSMQNDTTRLYYDKLSRKRFQLALKRGIDIALSLILILALSPVMAFCALW